MRAQPLALQASEMPRTNRFDDVVFEFAGGEVVEEEEGGSALDGDVVDAVVDEVRADGVVDAEVEGYLELGAYAVGRGDEDGVREPGEIEGEESSEASDLGEDVLIEGLAGEHLDALLGTLGGGDVDACIGVGKGISGRLVGQERGS